MTENQLKIEIKKIEKDKKLNEKMKRIAINSLKNRYNEYIRKNIPDESGFSIADHERMEKYKKNKIDEAKKLGLSENEIKSMNFDEICNWIVWKNGIDTRMDDSESGSMESAE